MSENTKTVEKVMEEKREELKKQDEVQKVTRKLGPVSIELNPKVDKVVGRVFKVAKWGALGAAGYVGYKLGSNRGAESVEPIKITEYLPVPEQVHTIDSVAETVNEVVDDVVETVTTY